MARSKQRSRKRDKYEPLQSLAVKKDGAFKRLNTGIFSTGHILHLDKDTQPGRKAPQQTAPLSAKVPLSSLSQA